ncbi:MAG: tetratricopeptide repeat protein, partial [Lepagella sp.]
MELKKTLLAALVCAASTIAYGQSSLTSGEEVVQPGRHVAQAAKTHKKKATVNRYDSGKTAVNPAYPASAPKEKREKTYHTEQYQGFTIRVADDEHPLTKRTPAELPATTDNPSDGNVGMHPGASESASATAPSPFAPQLSTLNPQLSAYPDSILRATDFPIYLKGAEQGDSESMRRVGLCYIYGTGVDCDSKAGLKWLGKAAQHENTEAQYDIGVVFRDGYGVRPNPSDAAFWFRKAARNGNARAQLAAGLLFLEGRGVQQDSRIAAENFWRAAEQGNVDAAYRLACMYRDGVGMDRDPAKAYHYFTVAGS